MCVYSGGSRQGHRVSETQSKFPELNENGQKSHFLQGFSDSEPGQHFVLDLPLVYMPLCVCVC